MDELNHTAIMNQEPLAEDEAGIIGIALELNGDLWPAWHHLEALSGPQVLANHVGHEVMSIVDGQHVIVAYVQTLWGEITRS